MALKVREVRRTLKVKEAREVSKAPLVREGLKVNNVLGQLAVLFFLFPAAS